MDILKMLGLKDKDKIDIVKKVSIDDKDPSKQEQGKNKKNPHDRGECCGSCGGQNKDREKN